MATNGLQSLIERFVHRKNVLVFVLRGWDVNPAKRPRPSEIIDFVEKLQAEALLSYDDKHNGDNDEDGKRIAVL